MSSKVPPKDGHLRSFKLTPSTLWRSLFVEAVGSRLTYDSFAFRIRTTFLCYMGTLSFCNNTFFLLNTIGSGDGYFFCWAFAAVSSECPFMSTWDVISCASEQLFCWNIQVNYSELAGKRTRFQDTLIILHFWCFDWPACPGARIG